MSNELDIRIDAYQPERGGCPDRACCPDEPLPLSPQTLKDLADAFIAVLDDFSLEGDVRVRQTVEADEDNYTADEEDEDEDDDDDDLSSPCRRNCEVCHPDEEDDDD